jgi:hypothetical protein
MAEIKNGLKREEMVAREGFILFRRNDRKIEPFDLRVMSPAA